MTSLLGIDQQAQYAEESQLVTAHYFTRFQVVEQYVRRREFERKSY